MGIFDMLKTTRDNAEEEKEDEEMEEETYEFNWSCDNCEEEEIYFIPKGILVETHMEGKICDVCGCKLMEE